VATASSLSSALASALESLGSPRIAWVESTPIESLDAARGASRLTLEEAGGGDGGDHDAAVIGPIASEWEGAVRASRPLVREGGVIALIVTVERDGLRGAAQRALVTFDARRRPRPLEDACTALLCAGISPVRTISIEGARGDAVVFGVVRP
jgi:hypothetical protein